MSATEDIEKSESMEKGIMGDIIPEEVIQDINKNLDDFGSLSDNLELLFVDSNMSNGERTIDGKLELCNPYIW